MSEQDNSKGPQWLPDSYRPSLFEQWFYIIAGLSLVLYIVLRVIS